MKILFAILLLLNAKPAHSQTAEIERFRQSLFSHSLPDTQRVILLSDLGYSMAHIMPDSAILYVQQATNLARKIGFVKGELYSRQCMGGILWIAGEYTEANELYLQALKYAKLTNDWKWEIETYWDLSRNSRDQGNYEEGLKYCFKAIELAKSGKRLFHTLDWCYVEAGAIYQEMNFLDSLLPASGEFSG